MGPIGDAMARIPWDSLPPSARVDVLGWYSGKPAIRVPRFARGADILAPLADWASVESASIAADVDFVVVSTHGAAEILAVDQSAEPHAFDLGIRLGYPACCSSVIADAGEVRIDELARTSELACRGTILDTSGYPAGCALISHVPCSPTCPASVELAHRCLATALAHPAQVWASIVRGFAKLASATGKRETTRVVPAR